MKRIIGLLLTVVFALALFSPPLRALDHPWNDPRFSGKLDKEDTMDSDPWAEVDKSNNDDSSILSNWFEATKLYFELFILDFNKNHTKINVIRNTNSKQNQIIDGEKTVDGDQNTDSTIPGNS